MLARLSLHLLAAGRPPKSAAEARAERNAILRILREQKGLSLRGLARSVPFGWSTLYARLGELERAGKIAIRAAGRHRIVVPSSVVVDPAREAAATLAPAARKVAAYIAENPGCAMQDIVANVPLAARTAHYHVHRLVEDGLVTTPSTTRYVDLRATPEFKRALR